MKVRITDQNALAAISLADLATYLRSEGWEKVDSFRGKGSIWVKGEDDILVPRGDFSDNPVRMAAALEILEKVEERSQLEIIRDLYFTGYDVFRIRNRSSEAANGTLPLPLVVELHNGAHDMVLAAACSAVSKKAIYPSRKPQKAENFMERVRMGQTEQGSYVVTVLSPIPPTLASGQFELLPVHDPFERQVSTMLSKGLTSIRNAALESIDSGDVKPFVDGVAEGVSANLCDAISRISRTADSGGLDVNITWSRNRESRSDVGSSVVISEAALPVIEEASRVFRETQPEPEYHLLGVVVKCHKEPNSAKGKVTVLDIGSGVPRRISIEMAGSHYEAAVEAHKDGKSVQSIGEVKRHGRGYMLVNNTPLSILEDEDED
ncbi:hypothetical protein [uncultured Pseudodesulfovibrio sp.]|uniref:hypothetical protein n=1 Tax=uncultured Pseudodesulfovibrio sp. TaxID=2035858 RepID=UPI0029C6961D|nr:hypothetical protein [uncultured Pseudodesulfovibrio sp.]